jgi:hypothetical protein
MPNIYDQFDAPGTSGANPYDRYDEPVKRTMEPRQQKGTARRLIEGGAMGVADLGNTLLNAASYLPGKVTDAVRGALPAEHRMRVPDISQMTRTRNADFDAITAENKDSTAFTVGRVGGNIAATQPVLSRRCPARSHRVVSAWARTHHKARR